MLSIVLVQPEMESWRAPLASIAPIPPVHSASQKSGRPAKGASIETATDFKENQIVCSGPIHRPSIKAARRITKLG